jgi:iron complex outermembrane recepter protein
VLGAEIELATLLTDSFLISLSVGYTDASYDSFDQLDIDKDGTPDPDIAKNLDLAHVPELNYNLSGNYDIHFENGVMTLRGSYTWMDERANDDLNNFVLDEYALLDASVTYETDNQNWKLSLFGKNLTNEQWFAQGFVTSFSSYNYLQPPRTYGVEVR